MSSAVVSTSAALGRPFLFDADPEPRVCSLDPEQLVPTPQSVISQVLQSTGKKQSSMSAGVTPASRLQARPAPEMASSGVAALDRLTGGLPRGCLTEICGPASSGRTSLMLAALAAATRRAEFCALLDASDALDPKSAATAGIDLERFLWVRCGEDPAQRHPDNQKASQNKKTEFRLNPRSESEQRLDQLLRATDLLLESGGFGLIVLDLSDLPPQSTRRIPLTTWFRFRRAVEYKPTILLAIEQHPIAGSCSSLLLQLATAERHSPKSHSQPEAAEPRQSAAHGASREEMPIETLQAPEGRKKTPSTSERPLDNLRFRQLPPASDPAPTHARLLSGLKINIEKICSRLDRKPAHSVTFETKTAWTG